jgi:acid phosphatase type 7
MPPKELRRILLALVVGALVVLGVAAAPGGVPARADGTDPVIAAAGNIACDPNNPVFNALAGTKSACRMKYVSDLMLNPDGTPKYSAVLALGDTQYICGGLAAYQQSYDPTWGRLYSVTHPVVGDKDFRTTANAPTGTDCTAPPGQATGFYAYFAGLGIQPKGPKPPGAGAYYSFNVPDGCTPDGINPCWHFVALNGNCKKAPGCVPGTTQYDWLVNDLATYPNSAYSCTVAFWHWPRFSSGSHGSDATFDPIWRLLYGNGVDVVLNAHEHTYERFAQQDPDGVADPVNGIREFVVGTGGASHAKFPSVARVANSEASSDKTFGVLALSLHLDSYDWQFIPDTSTLTGHQVAFTDASTVPTACH